MTPEQKVVRRFLKRIHDTVGYHQELLAAVYLKKHQASLETIIVEQFALSTAVHWEVFVNDLLLTYLVKGPKTYLTNLKKRVAQSTRDKYGPDVAKALALKLPALLTMEKAEALVDPNGYNVGPTDSAAIAKRANELLEAQYAKRFTLAAEEAGVVDVAIALRNYIGHRSTASLRELRQAVSRLTGVNADLSGSFSNSGTYLKSRVNGEPRSIILANRLCAVAEKLV
jgi:hypothetical protein